MSYSAMAGICVILKKLIVPTKNGGYMSTDTMAVALDDLQQLQLFKGVNLSSISEQLSACSVRSIEAGEILIARGQTNTNLYLLLSGNLRIYLDTMGENLIVLEPGSGVGEVSIIDKLPTTAHVVAQTRCQLLVISEEVLWSMVSSSHDVAINMLSLLASRLRDSNGKLAESQEREYKLKYKAVIDSSTGLYNRAWLEEELPKLITESRACKQSLSVVLMEIDDYDMYLQSNGQEAVERTGYWLAQSLLNDLRPVDMAVRISESRFMTILPDTDIATAIQVAEDLRLVMKETTVRTPNGAVLPAFTISAGVYEVSDTDDISSLIEQAETALQTANELGADNVCTA